MEPGKTHSTRVYGEWDHMNEWLHQTAATYGFTVGTPSANPFDYTAHDASDAESMAEKTADAMDVSGAAGIDEELNKPTLTEPGMNAGCKLLYAGKEDKYGRFQWTSKKPADLEKPAGNKESESWAIVVRKIRVYNDPTKVLGLHSILIQSPLLKEILADVLAGYPGVTVSLKRLEFSGKFEPLIHRWAELQAAIAKLKEENDPKSAEKLEHALLLHDLIESEFHDTIEWAVDLKEQGVTTFDGLWTLFQPNALVYTRNYNQDCVMRHLTSVYAKDDKGRPIFVLDCQYFDYDGTQFGTKRTSNLIQQFEGTRPISSLHILPFDCHPDQDVLRAKLIERGSMVESLAGSHYRAYDGVGWRTGHLGEKETYTVKGRIIIDTYGWNRFNPTMSVTVGSTPSKRSILMRALGPASLAHYDYGAYQAEGGIPFDGFYGNEEDEAKKREKLTDEQKLICSPLVRGYALKEKMWLNLFVTAVRAISFNDGAFASLVLTPRNKAVIFDLMLRQMSNTILFDDVIRGKGRGITVLLTGPPGVGKTLTAESLAEELRVPLYTMAAGDLGLESRSVETKLHLVMDMCTRWNAILLLDEADVFLETRSLHELERNKIVTVFLRLLEYFEGLMFFTTNRIETVDPAFESRMTIQLPYPPLDKASRKKVWENFLVAHDDAQAAAREMVPKMLHSAAVVDNKEEDDNNKPLDPEAQAKALEKAHEIHMKRTLPHSMSPRDMDKLAELEINGRRIKNVLKTAQLLSSQRSESLAYAHVMTVMDVTQHLHHTVHDQERARASVYY